MFHKRCLGVALAALLWAVSSGAFAADVPHAVAPDASPEQQLIEGIDQMRDGDAAGALRTLRTLTQNQPNFRLANLFYGDLLTALSGDRGGSLMDDSADPEVRDLTEEARLRLAADKATPAPGMQPSDILQLSPDNPYVIVVDLPRARLYLLRNDADGQMHLVRQQYAAMGRNGYGKQTSGDLRTPLGVYHITRWIQGDKLPEIYGAGAFPLNYPNLWDQFKKRDGAGIWLHGVPSDTYVRAPHSSEGCVTMANDDLLALKPYITLGQTPVVLSDDLKWEPAADLRDQRDAFLARIEDWRKKWSDKDTGGYLAYYGKDFSADGMDYSAFAAYKRRVNAAREFIGVQVTDISLFRYPGTAGNLVLAEFTLAYHSGRFDKVTREQQFWKRDEQGEWKIFREGNL